MPTTETPNRAPELVALSRSSGRKLVLGHHTYVYCDSECVAYAGPTGSFRIGATNETVRAVLREFDVMTYPVVPATAFAAALPPVKVR
jgi:hypothetical protein